jgi:hypothetical protein
MDKLFTGLYGAFASNATLSGAVTGMYYGTAPSDTNLPYITYNLISNVPTWDFGATKPTTYEQSIIQFSIFSDDFNSVSNICQIYSDLTLLYDDATLTMTGYNQIMLQRSSSALRQIPNEEVWMYTCDYDVMIQKT